MKLNLHLGRCCSCLFSSRPPPFPQNQVLLEFIIWTPCLAQCRIITLSVGRKLRNSNQPFSSWTLRSSVGPQHVHLLISVSGIDTAAEGGLVTGSPITKACSWELPLKDSIKSVRKAPVQLSVSFFSKLTRVEKPLKRSLLWDLFIMNYCGPTVSVNVHGAAAMWLVVRPAGRKHGAPAGAHRVPSCWLGPGSLPPSPHTSATLHKACARMVRCVMCCEMQQRQKQCAGMAISSEESSPVRPEYFCESFCYPEVLCFKECPE